MAFMQDAAFDAALNFTCDDVENLYVCSQEPSTFTEASSTYLLGTKATPTINAAADRSGGGRQRTVAAVSDGTVNSNGTATHWALTDNSESELKATGALSSSQGVTAPNVFTLTAFELGYSDAV